MARIVPVSLSGGAGTRLRPCPEAIGQFLTLPGERRMLQEMASLEAPLVPVAQR